MGTAGNAKHREPWNKGKIVGKGLEDRLVGYKKGSLDIVHAAIETSGHTRHSVITLTGRPSDIVHGTIFRVTIAELRRADAYETAEYRRDSVTLASDQVAWVYVDARSAKPGAVQYRWRRLTHRFAGHISQKKERK